MDFPIIHSYTRADAIRDGVLLDITEHAKHFGFKYPVAITATIVNRHINPSEDLSEKGETSENRIGLVLSELYYAIKSMSNSDPQTRIHFNVEFLMDAIDETYETIELIADCCPGDTMEPVITIMLPEDD